MIDMQVKPEAVEVATATAPASRALVELEGRIAVVLLSFLLALVVAVFLSSESQRAVAVPALVILFSFFLFCVMLDGRVKSGIFGEVGVIFSGFVVAYSVIPALNFLILNFHFPLNFDALNFAVLNPRPEELGTHLWRHCLFAVTVMAAYLLARGGHGEASPDVGSTRVDNWVVAAVVAMVLICVGAISLLSAPVEDYYGHYTRFDALSPWMRRFAFLCLILKGGGYYVALTLMFSDYRRFRVPIVLFVFFIVAYELSYSLGSRIETLSILLAVACLYHFNVARIGFRQGLLYLGVLLVLFTAVEFYRTAEFDIQAALRDFSERGLSIATEFGAVFYTSFHLYVERSNGTLPEREWLMLFNDFFTAVPFFEHTQFNSQYWYARQYFPDSAVPPQTMGPIADSAIWGGEGDLAVRGLLTGMGFGLLARWALGRRTRLLRNVAYVFVFATCVIALKYSLIYQVSQMFRALAPALLVAYFMIRLQRAVRPESNCRRSPSG
ncbi:hypothetical protein [Aromatoleum sp.]|uniref:hypothetical protein n=1 Tax=Aromatoleum sp. TaxID=2307007 RepID=UPI002FC6E587